MYVCVCVCVCMYVYISLVLVIWYLKLFFSNYNWQGNFSNFYLCSTEFWKMHFISYFILYIFSFSNFITFKTYFVLGICSFKYFRVFI